MHTFEKPVFPTGEVSGFGFHEAPRGLLSHWVVIENGVIKNDQAVVPTARNAALRNEQDAVGPSEASLLETPLADPERPLEVLRTIHSSDPCLACAVHLADVTQPNQVVLLGVGNVLMSDEGVGVHAVNALEQGYGFPDGVRCVDGGTSTQALLGDLEHLDHLIVLDAVTSGAAPATLLRLEGAAVPAACITRLSPHQVGISDLLATLTLLGRAPKHVVQLGVEPELLTLDLNLSPRVAARVPELVAQVLDELTRVGVTPTRKSCRAP